MASILVALAILRRGLSLHHLLQPLIPARLVLVRAVLAGGFLEFVELTLCIRGIRIWHGR